MQNFQPVCGPPLAELAEFANAATGGSKKITEEFTKLNSRLDQLPHPKALTLTP